MPGFFQGQLAGTAAERLSWLWHGYLAAGNVTLLTSQWKSGKNTLVAVLLAKLAQGGQLAGLAVRPGKAVVISEESGRHGLPRAWRPLRGRLHPQPGHLAKHSSGH
jgi:RecA-family ATPase